jgi:hypothetical protein
VALDDDGGATFRLTLPAVLSAPAGG